MAKTAKVENASKATPLPSSKRKNIVKKRHRGVHPPDVARPKTPVPMPDDNSESSYWGLTDESSYAEYAWAFLRRNRYYQHLCDKRKPTIPLSNWGYRSSPDREWGYGLTRLKHYSTAYSDGQPQWDGIQPFVQQLRLLPVQQRARSGAGLTVDYPKDQVAIVFDLSPLLGEGTTAIDIQLELARAHLLALAKPSNRNEISPADGAKTGRSLRAKGPSKKLLRAQLRIADLLSNPQKLSTATEPDPNSAAARTSATALRHATETYSPSNPVQLKVTDIADLIPSFDLKRTRSNSKANPSNDQRLNRASELAGGAWRNIYTWKMLGWLQFDDWRAFSQACADEPVGTSSTNTIEHKARKAASPSSKQVKSAGSKK